VYGHAEECANRIISATTEDKNGDNSDNSSEKYNDGTCT
jgi:hypothetical protein